MLEEQQKKTLNNMPQYIMRQIYILVFSYLMFNLSYIDPAMKIFVSQYIYFITHGAAISVY